MPEWIPISPAFRMRAWPQEVEPVAARLGDVWIWQGVVKVKDETLGWVKLTTGVFEQALEPDTATTGDIWVLP